MSRLRKPFMHSGLALMVCLVVRAAAQDRPAEPPEEDLSPHASVTLQVDAAGNRTIGFWSDTKMERLPEVLSDFLGCRLVVEHIFSDKNQSVLSARCVEPLPREDRLWRGELRTEPLVSHLRQARIASLYITVSSREDFPLRCEPADRYTRGMGSTACFYPLELDTPAGGPGWVPPRIEYQFHQPDLGRILAALGLVLAAPVFLTLLLRRRALKATHVDRAAIWFGYWRALNWITLGTVLAWWIALDATGFSDWERMLRLGPRADTARQWLAPFFIAPPLVVAVLCQALSYPVHIQIRRNPLRGPEILREGLWSLAASVVPLLMLINGVMWLVTGRPKSGVVWLLGALLIREYAARRLVNLTGMAPHALTTGELRDRVFALAEKLGVQLQQVYVLPAGKTRMANAFAVLGNTVIFTDYLLGYLSKREVDAVVAHELAHLKKKHPRGLLGAYLLGTLLVLVLGVALNLFTGGLSLGRLQPLHYILLVLAPMATMMFFSRRFEHQADLEAARLTGDPEAMITALIKLSRLNLMPIHWGRWDEKLLTHPSMVRRAEAIARGTGVAAERVPELLRAAVESSPEGISASPVSSQAEIGRRYEVPATVTGEGKVFSTLYKQRVNRRITLSVTMALALPAAAAAALMHVGGWEGPIRWLFSLGGFVLTLGVGFLTLNHLVPRFGRSELLRGLRRKARAAGLDPDRDGGFPVGLAPSAIPRIYETHWIWDAGYLFAGRDRLAYWGEETRFSLRRDQIISVSLEPGPPGWLSRPICCVRWRDTAGSRQGALSFSTLGATTAIEAARMNRALARRMIELRSATHNSPGLPEVFAELSAPRIGPVSSLRINDAVGPRRWAAAFVPVILMSVLVALASDLSFAVSDGLSRALVPEEFRRNLPPIAAPGWYVVMTALAAQFIHLVPYWRFREPAGPAESAGEGGEPAAD